MPATIDCLDCLASHEAGRSDTKYCSRCRLLRNLLYAASRFKRTRRCRGCGLHFRAMHARDTKLCGHCEAAVSKNVEVDCQLCSKRRAGVTRRGDIPVCIACAKQPEQRDSLVASLRKGQRYRRKHSTPLER